MRKIVFWVGALAALGIGSANAGTGSNVQPLSFGKDQTIVDVTKAVWGPLNVEGLPKGAQIAILRGDLAKADAEILLRFPPGYIVPNHSHTSDEVYVWLSGSFTLIAYDGTRTKFAGPAFMSFPGSAPPHGLECSGSEACVLYVRYSRPFDIKYFPEPPPKR